MTIRAKYHIDELKNGKSNIVITEIPYQVNRNRLLEKLGELVRDKKLPEISNIHDAADRKGIDIIIELKQNAMPQVVINKLFKHTQLQVGFGVIMLALVDGVPRVLSLKEVLHYYIKHQEEVIERRTRYELSKFYRIPIISPLQADAMKNGNSNGLTPQITIKEMAKTPRILCSATHFSSS